MSLEQSEITIVCVDINVGCDNLDLWLFLDLQNEQGQVSAQLKQTWEQLHEERESHTCTTNKVAYQLYKRYQKIV